MTISTRKRLPTKFNLSGASADRSFDECVKWNSKVITWSLADSSGPANSPFSGYMGSQYDDLVEHAFAEWSKVSGLTFEQVHNAPAFDFFDKISDD